MPLATRFIHHLKRLAFPCLLIGMLISSSGASQGLNDRQTIPAENVLARISSHMPVSYKSVVIYGDLDLDDLLSSGSIESSIALVDCDIEGNVQFDKSTLLKPINFEKTRFNGTASFDGAQFLRGANFSQCEFRGPVTFRGAKFMGASSFWKTIFSDFSTFRAAVFQGDSADFHKSEFQGGASFNFASFQVDKTDFTESKFHRTANFQKAVFRGEAVFLGSLFEDMAVFSESQFNSTSEFVGAIFCKELYFNNVEYNIFDITWESMRYKLICEGPSYISLIKNFKELGQWDDADSCYYQYREWKRINRPAHELTAAIIDYLAWISCGYGVRWTHTILSGILIIFLFAIYYAISESAVDLSELPSGKRSMKALNDGVLRNIRNITLLSIICLLSLPGEMYPNGKKAYSRFLRRHFFAVILERLLGWGLLLLMIGVISRLIVRY
jgi:uncharacterized protein YjbI with pentapeptide repeats